MRHTTLDLRWNVDLSRQVLRFQQEELARLRQELARLRAALAAPVAKEAVPDSARVATTSLPAGARRYQTLHSGVCAGPEGSRPRGQEVRLGLISGRREWRDTIKIGEERHTASVGSRSRGYRKALPYVVITTVAFAYHAVLWMSRSGGGPLAAVSSADAPLSMPFALLISRR